MARVHHYGLRDRPARGAKEVPYDERPLLGFNNKEISLIDNYIIQALSKGN
jgi:hypothetical protein